MPKTVDPVTVLRTFVQAMGTQKHAAEALGVGQTYLGDLLAGRRPFSARVLEALGLEKAVVKKA